MNQLGKFQTMVLAFSIAMLAAWPSAAKKLSGADIPDGAIKIDDLMIVDCLLPGQVRQMGTEFTYLSARRPIRTSAKDCAIRGGEYVAFDRANYGTALKIWLPAANQDDANAMNYVGEIYEKGLGVAPDFALAKSWYEKSAAKGNSSAMINLGSMFERGQGVTADMVQAMNWYRKASGLKGSDLEVVTESERVARRAQAEELDQLRIQTLDLKQQLSDARDALKSKQAQLAATQATLGAAQAKVASLGAASAQAQAARAQVVALQAQLAEQQSSVDTARMSTGVALSKLGVDFSKTGAAPRGTKPSINVISPKLALTRGGVLAAPLLTQVPTYQVIGRVYPSKGLRALKVNDQNVLDKIDEDGIFEVSVSVANANQPVAIDAVTADGLETTESFVLTSESQAASAAKRITTKMFARRMRGDLGTFQALVIGNNNYDGFAKLSSASSDASEIGSILSSRYGFKVDVLTNATRAQLLLKLSTLATTLKANDNLLIYYAGHGQIDAAGKGYWVPIDGKQNDPTSWVGNDAITDFLGATLAKHVMVVADSCYAGTLSGSAIRPIPATAKDEDVLFISRVKARTVLASGGLAPVLDSGGNGHSIFASAFIRALNSGDGLMDGNRLFEEVNTQVVQRSAAARIPQRPQYSALKHAGHQGSDFFLLPKDA
jgi:hypothetical protein